MTLPADYVTVRNLGFDSEQSQLILRSEEQALAEELPALNKYRNYYDGVQKLSYGTERFKDEFGEAFDGLVDNWCQVVIDAMLDKMEVIGVNIPDDKALSDKVWQALRANDLDAQQEDLHEGVLVEGHAYAILWPDRDLGVRFDWQPAQNVRIRYADDDARVPVWAIKRWKTDAGIARVNIYYPNRIEKYHQPPPERTLTRGQGPFTPSSSPTSGLQPFKVVGEPWPLPNPFNEIPVIEFPNRKGSEIKDVIPQQDAVNYLLTTAFAAGEFNALRQRVMIGNFDEPVGGWENSPGRVWRLPHALDSDGKPIESRVAEFAQSDLGPYRELIETVLQHIALTTKTPVRLFFKSDRGGRGDAPSGESLRIDDQPLIDKVGARQNRLGNAWYKTVQLAAKAVSNNYRLQIPPGEVVWRDPQADYRSALLADAARMKELGIPYDFIITKLGLSPDEVEMLRVMGPEMPVQPAGQPGEPEPEEEAVEGESSSE